MGADPSTVVDPNAVSANFAFEQNAKQFSFIEIYKLLSDALEADYLRCTKSYIQTIVKILEDKHYSIQKCPNDDSPSSISCYRNHLDTLQTQFESIDAQFGRSSCTEPVYVIVRNKMRDGFKLPAQIQLDAIVYFARNEIVNTELELVQLYKDISFGVKNFNGGCLKSYSLKVRKLLEDTRNDALKCMENISLDNDACYQNVLDSFRAYMVMVDRELLSASCIDPFFTPIMAKIRTGLKRLEPGLRAAIKTLGKTEIIDAVFDLVATYKNLVIGIKDNSVSCRKTYVLRLLKHLEETHIEGEKCSNGPHRGYDCYRYVLNDIRGPINNMEREIAASPNCNDMVFDPIRQNMQEALKLSEKKLVEGVMHFANTRIINENLDLVKTYKGVTFAIRNKYKGCMRGYAERTQSFLEDLNKDGATCYAVAQRFNDNQCFSTIINQLRTFFKQMEIEIQAGNTNCDDYVFNPMRTNIIEALKLSDRFLIEPIKQFSATQIIDATFDLVKVYRLLTYELVGNENSYQGCLKLTAKRVRTLLEDKHEELQGCVHVSKRTNDQSCYRPYLDPIRSIFNQVDREITSKGCVDLLVTEINTTVKEGLRLPTDMLIASIITFANTQIIEAEFNPDHIVRLLNTRIAQKVIGCEVFYLTPALRKMTEARDASEKCYDGGRKPNDDMCYKRILDRLRSHVESEGHRLTVEFPCSSPELNAYHEYIVEGLKLPNQILIQSVKVYGGAPAKTISVLASGVDECFKDEINEFNKVQELGRTSSNQCSEMVDISDLDKCVTAVYEKINAYFTSDARMKCFLTVMKPIKMQSVVENALAVVENATKNSNSLATENTSVERAILSPSAGKPSNEKPTASNSSIENRIAIGPSIEAVAVEFPAVGASAKTESMPASEKSLKITANPTSVEVTDSKATADTNPSSAEINKAKSAVRPALSNDDDAEEDFSPNPALLKDNKGKPNYLNVYKSIRDNIGNAGCSKATMIKALKKLEETNSTAAICRQSNRKPSKTSCTRKAVDDVQTFFVDIQNQLKTDGCLDPAFNPALLGINQLYQRNLTFNAMKSFSFYTLTEIRNSL